MKLNGILIAAIVLLSSLTLFLYRQGRLLEVERNTYKGNTNALLSDMKRMRLDSATTAVDVKALSLMVNEYELYRTADLEKIKQMGVELRNLKMAAKHELSVNAPVEADLRDSVVIRDTVRIAVKAIEMNTPYLQISGTIENNHLSGNIRLPVTLR
jgi:hypothetical protein